MKRWVVILALAAAPLGGCKEPVFGDIHGLFTPDPDPCEKCKLVAGADHECGRTLWCPQCRLDMEPDNHLCKHNHYCAVCKRTEVNGFHDDDATIREGKSETP